MAQPKVSPVYIYIFHGFYTFMLLYWFYVNLLSEVQSLEILKTCGSFPFLWGYTEILFCFLLFFVCLAICSSGPSHFIAICDWNYIGKYKKRNQVLHTKSPIYHVAWNSMSKYQLVLFLGPGYAVLIAYLSSRSPNVWLPFCMIICWYVYKHSS